MDIVRAATRIISSNSVLRLSQMVQTIVDMNVVNCSVPEWKLFDVGDDRQDRQFRPSRSLVRSPGRAERNVGRNNSRPGPREELRVHAGSSADGQGRLFRKRGTKPPHRAAELLLHQPAVEARAALRPRYLELLSLVAIEVACLGLLVFAVVDLIVPCCVRVSQEDRYPILLLEGRTAA